MTIVGWHASHEQISPSGLLRAVQRAEAAGFDAAMSSDHFAPWGERQGESGFAWSWLGAAMATTTLPFGVVNAPGQRYHPAIVAQAAATLSEMFPGRFWMALGSGEAANEHITGGRWPAKEIRDRRLLECVAVIRALLAGDEVSHDGLVRVDRARLYSRPVEPPPLFGAAVTPATAGVVGSWADGLITINQPHDVLRRLLDAFDGAGGAGVEVAELLGDVRTVRQVDAHLSRRDRHQPGAEVGHQALAPEARGDPVGRVRQVRHGRPSRRRPRSSTPRCASRPAGGRRRRRARRRSGGPRRSRGS